MSTLFPTALDGTNLPNPSNSYYLSGQDLSLTPTSTYVHTYQHDTINTGLRALEEAIGIRNSSDRNSLDWIGRHFPYHSRTANSMDDEFDAGTLDAKWTKRNETVSGNTVLYKFKEGNFAIEMIPSYSIGEYNRSITQPLPAGDWTFETKVCTYGLDLAYRYAGFVLADSALNKTEVFGSLTNNTNGNYQLLSVSKFTATSATFSSHYVLGYVPRGPLYLRIARVSSTLTFSVSFDGIYYYVCNSHSDTSWLTSCDLIGLNTQSTSFTGGLYAGASFEYFRRIA